MGEDRFAQEYLADFRKTQGLVYKEFDRSLHIYQSANPKESGYKNFTVSESLVGVDFGYTNPCAILQVLRDNDGNFFVAKEWYKTQKTTPEIIEIAKSFGGNKYYPDPAEPDRIEEMRRAKLNIREVSKDVEAGINAVREMLKTNRLFIHESCINLITEFETYSYPDKKADHNENESPIKEGDHAMDCLRYVIYMQVGRNQSPYAHTHYSQSAQPVKNTASGPQLPKQAHTYIPKL
jgi:phage terminase large subunit